MGPARLWAEAIQHKRLHDNDGLRTYAVVLQTGEEVMGCLRQFVTKERIFAAQITAIGALSDVVLQYFDLDRKEYQGISIREQVEVASIIGDIAQAPTGEPTLHIHMVAGKRDGTAVAGHLARGHVRPTLEIIINERAHLRKKKDPESGLALIQLED